MMIIFSNSGISYVYTDRRRVLIGGPMAEVAKGPSNKLNLTEMRLQIT